MELITVITTTLCIVLLVMLITPFSSSTQIHVQYSQDQQGHQLQLNHPTVLPRKLKLNEVIKSSGEKKLNPYDKQNEVFSGELHVKEANMMPARKGTWREWVEGTDTSQFFTMDYTHVKRRRPIHNKSLPVAP